MKIKAVKFEKRYPDYDNRSRIMTEKLMGNACVLRKLEDGNIYQEFIIPDCIYDGLVEALSDGVVRRYILELTDSSVDFLLAYKHGILKGMCIGTKELVTLKRDTGITIIHLTGDRIRAIL